MELKPLRGTVRGLAMNNALNHSAVDFHYLTRTGRGKFTAQYTHTCKDNFNDAIFHTYRGEPANGRAIYGLDLKRRCHYIAVPHDTTFDYDFVFTELERRHNIPLTKFREYNGYVVIAQNKRWWRSNVTVSLFNFLLRTGHLMVPNKWGIFAERPGVKGDRWLCAAGGWKSYSDAAHAVMVRKKLQKVWLEGIDWLPHMDDFPMEYEFRNIHDRGFVEYQRFLTPEARKKYEAMNLVD